MLLTYRFLLRPTSGQHSRLAAVLEGQRQLYNAALQERIEAWRKAKVSITKFDQCKSLTQIRVDDPQGFGAVSLQVSRWTLVRLDDAFKAMFGRAKRGGAKIGFPRFRAFGRWRSFGIAEGKGIRIRNRRILFKGMDRPLRVNWHRQLPADAKIKSATFTRRGRRWFVSLQIETNEIVARSHAHLGTSAGVDAGVESLAIWDDGVEHGFIENARAGAKRRRAQRTAQRELARCKRGSKGRIKARRRLERLHECIANHRDTALHQASAAIAACFETIFVEKLSLKNMTRSAAGTVAEPGENVAAKAGLNRAILDAGMGRLRQLLIYKAERAGGSVVAVDPKGTSQVCSGCGANAPKPLAQRRHRCDACGLDVHRDVNAARNIRAKGLAALAASRGVIAPGEPNVAGCGERAPGTLLAA